MKKLIAGFLLFCLFIQPAFASELYQYSVKSELYKNNTASYDTTLILTNVTSGEFNYLIEGSPYAIEYSSDGKCRIQERILGKEIICYFNQNYTSTAIKISYNADDKVAEKDDHLLYDDSLKMTYNIKTFSYLVKLPEGTGLIKTGEQFYPDNALLGSDGRRSILVWNIEDMNADQNFEARVAYEVLSNFDYSILYIPLIIIVILVAVIMFLKKRDVNIVPTILKQDEKKVYEAIMKHGTGIKQKIVVQESGYSKAKVSKLLKNLQERGVVKLERLGRTNRIHIVDKSKIKKK